MILLSITFKHFWIFIFYKIYTIINLTPAYALIVKNIFLRPTLRRLASENSFQQTTPLWCPDFDG